MKSSSRVIAIVVSLLICLALAWPVATVVRTNRKARALTSIAELGGMVERDWEVDDRGRYLCDPERPEQDFFLAMLHRDPVFDTVCCVDFTENDVVGDDDLAVLRVFPDLRGLFLFSNRITDEGARFLKDFPKLKFFSLNGATITDNAVSHLLALKELRYLNLRGTKISEEGIDRLRELPNLQSILVDCNDPEDPLTDSESR